MKAKTRIASFVAVVGSDSLADFELVPFLGLKLIVLIKSLKKY